MNTAPADRTYLTIRETCFRLSMSRATIYRLIKEGELLTEGTGRLRRVVAASLHAFIEQHTVRRSQ